jgi:hypothetical protein
MNNLFRGNNNLFIAILYYIMATIHQTVVTGDYFEFHTIEEQDNENGAEESLVFYYPYDVVISSYIKGDLYNTPRLTLIDALDLTKEQKADLTKEQIADLTKEQIADFVIGVKNHVYMHLIYRSDDRSEIFSFRGNYYMIRQNGSLSVSLDRSGKKIYKPIAPEDSFSKKIYKPIAPEDSFSKKICDALTPGCFKTRSRVHAESGGSKKRAKKTRKQRKHRNLKRNHKK